MATSELAALQAALIDAFWRAESVEEARTLLAKASLSAATRPWIEASDARALATAIALVRRWAEFESADGTLSSLANGDDTETR